MSEETSDNPRRARYSLRTLLLATLFLAMALAIVVLSWEVIPQRAEIQQLRNEAGYLTIEDPTKVHAIRIDTESPLMWKWKIHVPAGDGWLRVGSLLGDIPAAGDEPRASAGIMKESDDPQEVLVQVRIYQDAEGQWLLETKLVSDGTASSGRNRLSDDELAALRSATGWSADGVGKGTRAAEEDKPLVLLRRRFHKPGASININGAGEGVLIWVETREDD